MTHLAQEYLKTNTLEQLESEYGINYRVHGHKVSLNYDMLEAKDSCPVAKQCRGTILAKVDGSPIVPEPLGETVIISRPMDRFFNYGQIEAASIDFTAKSVRFYEKYDGTMVALYHDSFLDKWCVSTRSVPEADLPIDGFGEYTFRSLFEEAFKKSTGINVETWANHFVKKGFTYIFELCTPLNRIVVNHDDFFVVLLAIRDCKSGKEHDIHVLGNGVPVCKTYTLSSLNDLIEFVSSRDPLSHEGVVVCDVHTYQRVKIKSPNYLALSRIKDSAVSSPRALLQLILLGKIDDALPVLPKYMIEQVNSLKEKLIDHIHNVDQNFSQLLQQSENMSRKEVALYVKEHMPSQMSFVMQSLYGRKIMTYREWIDSKTDPNTGEYNKNFLDNLLNLLNKA